MQAHLRARLAELRQEHACGLAALAELRRREEGLRATLLRIGGAVQVLEELLGEAAGPPAPAPPPGPVP